MNEDEFKALLNELFETLPDEPPFFSKNVVGMVSLDWCKWYVKHTGVQDKEQVLAVALVKMLLFKVSLDTHLHFLWEEESEKALAIIKDNPQLWGMLESLGKPPPKPTGWRRWFSWFK